LYYYDHKSRMELDFVFRGGVNGGDGDIGDGDTDGGGNSFSGGLTIVEVKSGNDYRRHASLDKAPAFVNNARSQTPARRIVLCKGNLERSRAGVDYLPLYMAMFL